MKAIAHFLAILQVGLSAEVHATELPVSPRPGFRQLVMLDEALRLKECTDTGIGIQAEIIDSEVNPSSVKPGENATLTFIYVSCSSDGRLLHGTIKKSLSYQGSKLSSKSSSTDGQPKTMKEWASSDYLIRPGVWADDDILPIPESAPAGIYNIRWELSVSGAAGERHSVMMQPFEVR